jgi:hypothetical protein
MYKMKSEKKMAMSPKDGSYFKGGSCDSYKTSYEKAAMPQMKDKASPKKYEKTEPIKHGK